ncbi:Guanosine-diphosphatase [Actinomortierella ambigua]|uniref:Guanosine-diphosphatase n=1 Tax=Actinomortierella ambigua TaxID=1343610 RepID=A0A9P6Q3Y8_9FUNG|nr:Guanosine-diphosphatase [Actinomortierella ambigua]
MASMQQPPQLDGVKHILLVMSGKGGVGKSSVTTQLALTLVARGKKVGVLDIDLCGPSIPRMLGLDGKGIHQSSAGWVPVFADENKKLCCMSIGFMLENKDDSVVWRGPKKTAMIRQFLTDTCWGELDYLIIDTPPGTSDENISIVEHLKGFDPDGVVLVTTPQAVALADVRKQIGFCRQVGVPVLGLVENMSGYICPHCSECNNLFSSGGGETMAEEFAINFLGRVPIDPTLTMMDTQLVTQFQSSSLFPVFEKITERVEAFGIERHPTEAAHPPATSLHKRNSLKLPKRISSSSLLPSNYTNKKPTFSSTSSSSNSKRHQRSIASKHASKSRLASVAQFFSIENVMALKDNIMARKGYWLRNAAILVFGLTVFFLVMVPRNQKRAIPTTQLNRDQDILMRPWPKDITSDHCTLAHPGRPLIQYVLMVDAGSTGSRIHVYKFNYCKATPELEGEIFEHLEPGLSSYDNDAEGAAESLDPLLKLALKTVPSFLHTSTPIAVKATAGLRKLGDEKSDRILAAVRDRLEDHYPFPIIAEDGVVVMEGADEVNYLLDRFNSLNKKPTVAILDLGGGSTQVVFEPKLVGGHSIAQGTHRYPLQFNGNDYILFQHSYLGYGLMEARNQVNEYVAKYPIAPPAGIELGPHEVAHPCLTVRSRVHHQTVDGRDVTLVGTSDQGGQCRKIVEAIFNKEAACHLNPCSFNGVYQPSFRDSFTQNDIYAFSFFFDRTAPFRLGEAVTTQEMTILELEELTDRVCKADEDNFVGFKGQAEAEKAVLKNELCMDLSYIYGLLEFGYGIPKERKIKLAKKIKDYETGWCLGASIRVLEERDWYQIA